MSYGAAQSVMGSSSKRSRIEILIASESGRVDVDFQNFDWDPLSLEDSALKTLRFPGPITDF